MYQRTIYRKWFLSYSTILQRQKRISINFTKCHRRNVFYIWLQTNMSVLWSICASLMSMCQRHYLVIMQSAQDFVHYTMWAKLTSLSLCDILDVVIRNRKSRTAPFRNYFGTTYHCDFCFFFIILLVHYSQCTWTEGSSASLWSYTVRLAVGPSLLIFHIFNIHKQYWPYARFGYWTQWSVIPIQTQYSKRFKWVSFVWVVQIEITIKLPP